MTSEASIISDKKLGADPESTKTRNPLTKQGLSTNIHRSLFLRMDRILLKQFALVIYALIFMKVKILNWNERIINSAEAYRWVDYLLRLCNKK